MKPKITICIADDHPIFLAGMKSIISMELHLKILGSAENGKKALELILEKKPDIAILDIEMPEMNGFEITEKIRKMEAENGVENQVPIIALTANTLDNDRDKCMEVGMNEYLSKPFTAIQLVEKIQKFIQPE
jgi:CheY-like chemotaxis protein